jgi:hypothetical protein
MALTVPAMVVSVGITASAALATVWYVGRQAKGRLALAEVDLASYCLAAGGTLSLIPEAVAAFAPELMFGASLAGTGLEHLDYLAFLFVSLSFGMGFARRWLIMQLEKAS